MSIIQELNEAISNDSVIGCLTKEDNFFVKPKQVTDFIDDLPVFKMPSFIVFKEESLNSVDFLIATRINLLRNRSEFVKWSVEHSKNKIWKVKHQAKVCIIPDFESENENQYLIYWQAQEIFE